MLERQNRRACILSLCSALIVVLCTCVGVVMNLTTLYDENFDHMGLKTFCMFTVNSNILVAIGMALVVPYTIDGLRKSYYHLPNWLVIFLQAGVTSVTLTFLVSLLILSPVKGFRLIFTGSRFFLHGVGPLLSFAAFCFFITDHYITRGECLLAMIPELLYACVYFTLVVLVGEARGGWNDFYGFVTYIPSWLSLLLFPPVVFGVASLVRFFHNRSFRRLREIGKTDKLDRAYVENELDWRAREEAMIDARRSDIVIPRRFIKFLIENADSGMNVREACLLYLNRFLDYTRY